MPAALFTTTVGRRFSYRAPFPRSFPPPRTLLSYAEARSVSLLASLEPHWAFLPLISFFCDAVAGKTFPRAGSPGTDGKGTCESHPRSRQTGKLFGRQCSPPPRFPRQPPYCQYGHSSTTPFSPAGNSVFQAPRAVGSGSCELPRFDCPRVFVGRGICPLYPTTSSCVCRKCDRYRDSMCTNFFVDRGVLLARHLAIASPPRAFVVGSKRRDANAP